MNEALENLWRGAAERPFEAAVQGWAEPGREIAQLTFTAEQLRRFAVRMFMAGAEYEHSRRKDGET